MFPHPIGRRGVPAVDDAAIGGVQHFKGADDCAGRKMLDLDPPAGDLLHRLGEHFEVLVGHQPGRPTGLYLQRMIPDVLGRLEPKKPRQMAAIIAIAERQPVSSWTHLLDVRVVTSFPGFNACLLCHERTARGSCGGSGSRTCSGRIGFACRHDPAVGNFSSLTRLKHFRIVWDLQSRFAIEPRCVTPAYAGVQSLPRT